MNKKLIDELPSSFKDCFPINVSFVEGIDINPMINEELKFVTSDFYNTKKMACYSFYKPSFLRKNYGK